MHPLAKLSDLGSYFELSFRVSRPFFCSQQTMKRELVYNCALSVVLFQAYYYISIPVHSTFPSQDML